MPFDLTAILLDAARAADEPVPPLRPVDDSLVQRILASLPTAVRRAREDDPTAAVFRLLVDLRAEGGVKGQQQLVDAVAAALASADLTGSYYAVSEPTGKPAFVITFASLRKAVDITTREGWIKAALPLWRERAGSTASLVPALSMPWLVEFTATPPGGPPATFASGFGIAPAEAITAAATALRLPGWTLEQLATAWTARAGEGATVELRQGHPGPDGAWVPVACLRFAARGAEVYADVLDLRELDADAVIARVVDTLRARPPTPRVVATESPVAASPPADVAEEVPTAPRPGKGGKRRGAEA